MDCKEVVKNIPLFIKDELKGKILRRTLSHIENCKNCQEILFDEYSFYTTFNDLDTSLDFNYRRSLEDKLRRARNNIDAMDAAQQLKYIIASIFVCMIGVFIMVIAVRLAY